MADVLRAALPNVDSGTIQKVLSTIASKCNFQNINVVGGILGSWNCPPLKVLNALSFLSKQEVNALAALHTQSICVPLCDAPACVCLLLDPLRSMRAQKHMIACPICLRRTFHANLLHAQVAGNCPSPLTTPYGSCPA